MTMQKSDRTKKSYRYTECGLDNVFVIGVSFLNDDADEKVVTIPNVNNLHMAIAHGIVMRKSMMSGRELRFLRTEMGMTQAELASIMHREPLTISRWERGETEIDPNAETLIRLHAIEQLGLDVDRDVGEISGWSVRTAPTSPIMIDGSDPANYHVEVAA